MAVGQGCTFCTLYFYSFYYGLGTAYYRLFKFDKAELCHYQHLQLAKPSASALALASKRPPNKKEEMIALTNLGCVYQAKREFELALQTFKKAYDIAEEVFSPLSLIRASIIRIFLQFEL